MKIVENSENKFVFEEWNAKFDSGDKVFHSIIRVGCFLPLAVTSLLLGRMAFVAYDRQDIWAALVLALMVFVVGFFGWGGLFKARSIARKGQSGFRYTFSRGRTPVVEVVEPSEGLKPYGSISLGPGSYLRYWREKGKLGPHTSSSVRYRRVSIVEADGTEVKLGGEGQQSFKTCLLKLLNVSRITRVPIRLEGPPQTPYPQNEFEFSTPLNELFSVLLRTEECFEYHIPASSKNVSSIRWTFMTLAFIAGGLFLLFPFEMPQEKVLPVLFSLGLAALMLVWNLKDRFSSEYLLVDSSGFVHNVNGKERFRHPLSDLLEVRAFPFPPESELAESNYLVWLFFPDSVQPLLENKSLSMADAQQVVLSIRKVLQEHGQPLSDGPFGSHLLDG